MKRVWVNLLFLLMGVCAWAQNYERIPEVEQRQYGQYAFVEVDFASQQAIRAYWAAESKRKQHAAYEYSLCGNSDCVYKVTILSGLLFVPNDTMLLVAADELLRPFLRLVRGDEAVATVLVSCFSDNNGSDAYLDAFTKARARSLQRWFIRQGTPSGIIRPYGFGNQVPRTDNKTLAHRAQNRRVTLYFVPSRRMVKLAKKGKLQPAMSNGTVVPTTGVTNNKIGITSKFKQSFNNIWQKN